MPVAGQSEQEQFPAVEVAYDFVVPSYQLMTSRFEAADTRLTTLLTIVSSLALGVPLFTQSVNENISYASPLFILAMVFAIAAAVIGVVGRVRGRIMLCNPGVLYDKGLKESAWEFKKNALYFAGQHFTANKQAIDDKGKLTRYMTVAMLLSVLAFILWIATASAQTTGAVVVSVSPVRGLGLAAVVSGVTVSVVSAAVVAL